MLHDAFNRLCQARDLLAEVPEQQLSIKDIAREVHGNTPAPAWTSESGTQSQDEIIHIPAKIPHQVLIPQGKETTCLRVAIPANELLLIQ